MKNNGWISVDDRLPEPELEVLVLAKVQCEFTGYKGITITTAMYEDLEQSQPKIVFGIGTITISDLMKKRIST